MNLKFLANLLFDYAKIHFCSIHKPVVPIARMRVLLDTGILFHLDAQSGLNVQHARNLREVQLYLYKKLANR